MEAQTYLTYCDVITEKALAHFHDREQSMIERVTEIMDVEGFPMHYPTHHYLAPALLLSECCKRKGLPEDALIKYLHEARKRADNVLGGFCGFYGACGAAVGLGIFWSVFTNSTPVSKITWRYANGATGKALCDLAEIGGPRCCKRAVFMVLSGAIEQINQVLELDLPQIGAVECRYSRQNTECLKQECPYYAEDKQ